MTLKDTQSGTLTTTSVSDPILDGRDYDCGSGQEGKRRDQKRKRQYVGGGKRQGIYNEGTRSRK